MDKIKLVKAFNYQGHEEFDSLCGSEINDVLKNHPFDILPKDFTGLMRVTVEYVKDPEC